MADELQLPDWITDHIKLYREDPEKAHMWDSTVFGGPGILPALLLTTKGAKTGQSRSLPLIYQAIDGTFVIIASKGGAPANPSWFVNLEANPDCEIQVGKDHHHVTARVAEGDERSNLWSKMLEVYPAYNDYQAATDREIPVIVLDPK